MHHQWFHPTMSSIPVGQPIIVGQLLWHHLTRHSAPLTVSSLCQGDFMPKFPTSCQRGRARQSAHPEHSRKRCWFPRTGRAEQSWLTRCCQRTGRNNWHKRSHWSQLEVDKGRQRKVEGSSDVWRKEGNRAYINRRLLLACTFEL